MGIFVNFRFILPQPHQLCQGQRTRDFRQTGGPVKFHFFQGCLQLFRLGICPVVQPDDKGTQRIAVVIHGCQRLTLGGHTDGGHFVARSGIHRFLHAVPDSMEVNPAVSLHPIPPGINGIFPDTAADHFHLRVKQADLNGAGTHVQSSNTNFFVHMHPPLPSLQKPLLWQLPPQRESMQTLRSHTCLRDGSKEAGTGVILLGNCFYI